MIYSLLYKFICIDVSLCSYDVSIINPFHVTTELDILYEQYQSFSHKYYQIQGQDIF